MKIRALVYVLYCLFLLGMSGTALAVQDTEGESIIGDVDIRSASVVTYYKVMGPEDIPQFAKIGIEMAPGSHLPAAIVWDFDVDNDTATGGGSLLTRLPNGTCGGQVCKPPAGDGFDFFIVLALRTQGDSSTLATCNGCSGPPFQCATRGPSSYPCDEGTCYGLGTPCAMGDPDCYEITEPCSNCTGGDGPYYPLTDVCGTHMQSCASGMVKGEYYVGFGQGRESYFRGNVNVRTHYSVINETDICVTIPWGLIVERLWEKISEKGTQPVFDMTYAVNDPPRYQVSAYFDEDFVDEDDLFTFNAGLNLDISDWLPDTARVADGEYTWHDDCQHNSAGGYGDLNVSADDVSDFLSEFGRTLYWNDCPNCKK
jgi:hypothetical protein